MIKINLTILALLLKIYIFPITRITTFFVSIPIFGNNVITKIQKIYFSLLLSFIVMPLVPTIHISLNIYTFIKILMQEICIGLVLGFFVQIFFFIPILSGDIISSQIGISFSTIFDITNKLNLSVMSNFFRIFHLMLFFAFKGHLFIISIIVKSFFAYPVNCESYNLNFVTHVIHFFIYSFLYGITLMLPIIILLLLINIILAFLNRISPQISIFSISFPITVLTGTISLYFFIPTFYASFNQCYLAFFQVINTLLT